MSLYERLTYNVPSNKSKIFQFFWDEEVVWLMSFIGGYVDAAGYFKLYGLFTSSVTGSVIAACASIFQTYGVVSRVFVAIAFALGGGFSAGAVLKGKLAYGWKEKGVSKFVLALEVVAIVVSIALGLWFESDLGGLDDWQVILVASVMAFAMGVHSAAVKELIPTAPATTVMTLTILGVSMQFFNALSYFFARYSLWDLYLKETGSKPSDYNNLMEKKLSDSLTAMSKSTKPLFFFTTGALLGTAVMKFISFWSLGLPVVLLVVLLLDVTCASRKERQEALLAASRQESEGRSLISAEEP